MWQRSTKRSTSFIFTLYRIPDDGTVMLGKLKRKIMSSAIVHICGGFNIRNHKGWLVQSNKADVEDISAVYDLRPLKNPPVFLM